MHHQEFDLIRIEIDGEAYRRREVAKQRWGRCGGNIAEREGLLASGYLDQAVRQKRAIGKRERKVVAIRAEQSESERDRHRLLAVLPWRRWHHLIDRKLRLFRLRVIVERAGELRRSGLVVPEHELGKVPA